MLKVGLFALTFLAVTAPAFAQDVSQGVGPLPTPNTAATPTPICTDRPTKANVACTVPQGDVQIETDAINWTRTSAGNTQTDTVLYTNPLIKYGVGEHTDLEVSFTPYETVRTRGVSGVDTAGGFGDVYLRLKQKLTPDLAKTQISIIPFVKVPTAPSSIGNREFEGGAIIAANVPLPTGFTLTVGPEIDVLADSDGSGQHASFTMLGNLSHGIGKKLTVFSELWTQQNLDPAGTVHEYSFDVAAAYLVTKTLQFDLGGNFGLNHETPATQVYLGVSTRF